MSSSTNSAFLRALSPSLNAITNAIISTTFAHDNNIDDKNIQLSNELIANFHGKLSSASSIDQLLTCIYPEYQDAIKEKVLEYASWADKWEMSKTSCNRLSSSATAGSTPQRLRVTAPADTYQKSIANCALTAKQVEVLFWQGKCNVESATQVLDGLLSERWKAVQKTSLVPSIIIDENGTTNLGPWEVSPQKIAEGVVMRRAVPLIINRILDIVEIRHRALSRKIEKKSAVSKKAEQALGDVEPKDVGAAVAGPSIQSLIDKGLNARLEKLESAKKPKKVTLKSHSLLSYTNEFSYPDYVWWNYAQDHLYPHLYPQEGRSLSRLSQGEVRRHQGEPQAAVQVGESQGGRGQEKRGRFFEKGREEKGKREEIGDRASHQIVSQRFPIPDSVLTMTWDKAISYVLVNAPLSLLSAGLFKSNVHCSTGVVVPRENQHDLSAK